MWEGSRCLKVRQPDCSLCRRRRQREAAGVLGMLVASRSALHITGPASLRSRQPAGTSCEPLATYQQESERREPKRSVRWVAAGFPPLRPGFEPRSSRIGIVEDLIQLNASYSSIIWSRYNTPNSGRPTKWTQSHPIPQKETPWLVVRKRTISSERSPPVGEVSANFCG